MPKGIDGVKSSLYVQRQYYAKMYVTLVRLVVGTKIARSRVLGIYASCNHSQSVDIG